mgnify:CR=1 FL=1
MHCCDRHKELTKLSEPYDDNNDYIYEHYGFCMYCMLEGDHCREEYDSIDEVVTRANTTFVNLGYRDCENNFNFLESDNIQKDVHCDMECFRKLYNFGYQYCKKGYDKELLNIIQN